MLRQHRVPRDDVGVVRPIGEHLAAQGHAAEAADHGERQAAVGGEALGGVRGTVRGDEGGIELLPGELEHAAQDGHAGRQGGGFEVIEGGGGRQGGEVGAGQVKAGEFGAGGAGGIVAATEEDAVRGHGNLLTNTSDYNIPQFITFTVLFCAYFHNGGSMT